MHEALCSHVILYLCVILYYNKIIMKENISFSQKKKNPAVLKIIESFVKYPDSQ